MVDAGADDDDDENVFCLRYDYPSNHVPCSHVLPPHYCFSMIDLDVAHVAFYPYNCHNNIPHFFDSMVGITVVVVVVVAAAAAAVMDVKLLVCSSPHDYA